MHMHVCVDSAVIAWSASTVSTVLGKIHYMLHLAITTRRRISIALRLTVPSNDDKHFLGKVCVAEHLARTQQLGASSRLHHVV